MFLSPIAQRIPGCATAALIYVGLLMMGSVKDINRDDFKKVKGVSRVIAFLFVAMLLLTH